jgi:hypothetical protein
VDGKANSGGGGSGANRVTVSRAGGAGGSGYARVIYWS